MNYQIISVIGLLIHSPPKFVDFLKTLNKSAILFFLQTLRASLVAQLVENPLAVLETWVGKIP